MKSKYVPIVLAMALMATMSTLAFAQGATTSASLSGVVTDTQGAVIPGADVLAKHNATSAESRAVTNTEGRFTIPALNPGTYTVTVSLQGFKTAQLPDVVIVTATPASIAVKMEVGGVEETVVVRGATDVVQTQTAAVTTTINVQQISSLPLVTRTALDYVTMLPGALTTGSNSRGTTINGLPTVSINITLDGVNVQDNNNRSGDGFFMYIRPLMDSVEEITVSTSTPEAASSGQGAAQIRLTTRAGSSKFSGSIYDTWRNQAGTSDSDVNARTKERGWLWRLNTPYWFNKRDRPRTAAGDYFIDDVRLETPGFRVGGPIFTNDLTYFFNWEWFKWPNQVARTRYLMTDAARTGDFTYTASDGSRRTVNLYALAGGTPDPTTAKMFADIRAAAAGHTTGGSISSHDLNTDRFDYSPGGEQFRHFPTGRLDYNITANHRLTTTLRYNRFESDPDILNNVEPKFPGFTNVGGQYSHRYMAQGTVRSTFGTNIVNEARYGFSGGTTQFFTNVNRSSFDCTAPGCQGKYNLSATTNPAQTILTIGGGGQPLTGATATNGPSTRYTPDYVFEDTVSWLRGRHTLQFGGTYTRIKTQNMSWPGGLVPTVTFGVNSADPAFPILSETSGNFPGGINATQAGFARNLYAMLTGRVTQIAGTYVLDDAGNYQFSGQRFVKNSMDEVGLFVSDSWRVRPNLTLNAGLRYELQLPFKPDANSFSRLQSFDQIYGITGPGNLFKPGTMTGTNPVFEQFVAGDYAYDTDYNNFGPSIGATWQPTIGNGFLSKILSANPVFRGGYAVSFDRYGTQDFIDRFGGNSGATRSGTRSLTLSGAANLNADGRGLPVLLRDDARLSPFAAPVLSYPFSPAANESVHGFDPEIYVPYTHQYSFGWQRELGRDMAVEVRYIGNQNVGGWNTFNLNANANWNILENGFYDEYRRAQRNLAANIAAGRGNTFEFTGAPGTSPLPIFMAYFKGIPLGDARNQDPAQYASGGSTNNFRSSAWFNQLAFFNATITNIAGTGTNGLQQGALATNATTAGLPANFFMVNPAVFQANAQYRGNGGTTRYDALQLEVRRRLSKGLLVQASYNYGTRSTWSRPSLRSDFLTVPSTVGPDQAAKFNWVYQLPFGRGRRFASNAGWLREALVGGWEFAGNARFQSGEKFNIGGRRLVGMTADDVQKMFKFYKRPDATGKTQIFMFPEDVIDQTIIAFNSWSATHSSGYVNGVVPTGRYFAPVDNFDCVQYLDGDCDVPITQTITAPWYGKTDFAFAKRFAVGGGRFVEARMDLYNVFDNINFNPIGVQTGASRASWQVNAAARDINASQDAGGRITSYSLRFSW
jgi:hypothetical protein